MIIEIKNWEAIENSKQGEEITAIPLPGCSIKGEIDNQEVTIETKDINLSTLIITDKDNTKYRLSGARADYLGILNNFIEIGKNKSIEVNPIDLEEEINKGNER